MTRIGAGSLLQESNTFSPLLTSLDDFGITVGPALVERWRDTRTEIAGFLDVLHRPGIETVPLLAGWALTKGCIEAGAFAQMKRMLTDSLRAAGPLDGLLLACHGSMCAEGEDDTEGALLEVARSVIGPAVPLCLTLDLHANLTRRMVSLADAIIGYRTYPHIDMFETGVAAGELLLRTLSGGPRPRTVLRKLPLIVPGENMQTTHGPMAEVWRYAGSLRPSEILSFSVFGVQAWLDIEEMGGAVVAVTSGSETVAQFFCDAVAQRFWDLRRDFEVTLLTPEAAIRQALATEGQPVVLSESSDSPTAGSPGDSADMLRALLAYAPGIPSCVWLRDEAAVQAVSRAGIGTRLHLSLGGTHDPANRRPVTVDAEVRSLSDGRFLMRGSQYTGMPVDMGLTAVLQVDAVTVVVSSLGAINIDPELYRSQNVEPRAKKIVVVKSATAFRAEYAPFAAGMILVDTPGISSANLATLPWKRVSRPIYPLDAETQFDV
jgi:microcystin degradation protein MlrC